MRNLFPGYFEETEEGIKEIWSDCIFAFDANVILNLYRYSDSTRKEFFNIFEKLGDRIWLPNRAAEEYLKGSLKVIGDQEESYDKTCNEIQKLKNRLEANREHPFVKEETLQKVSNVFDELIEELEENKKDHAKLINNDKIKSSVADIFEEKVGDAYSDEELKGIIEEGRSRYERKIPPGYSDGGKQPDSEVTAENCRKFGDLIIWKQVIDKAVKERVNIVLVTDDKKEDWWLKSKGKTVGPRPEMVEEFMSCSGQAFHMYKADRFLVLARENLGEEFGDDVVDEVRSVSKNNEDYSELSAKKDFYQQSQLGYLSERINSIELEKNNIVEEMSFSMSVRDSLRNEISFLDNDVRKSWGERSAEEQSNLVDRFFRVREELEACENRIDEYNNRLSYLQDKLMECYEAMSKLKIKSWSDYDDF